MNLPGFANVPSYNRLNATVDDFSTTLGVSVPSALEMEFYCDSGSRMTLSTDWACVTSIVCA